MCVKNLLILSPSLYLNTLYIFSSTIWDYLKFDLYFSKVDEAQKRGKISAQLNSLKLQPLSLHIYISNEFCNEFTYPRVNCFLIFRWIHYCNLKLSSFFLFYFTLMFCCVLSRRLKKMIVSFWSLQNINKTLKNDESLNTTETYADWIWRIF